MRNNLLAYIGLFTTLVLSFFIISRVDYYPESDLYNLSIYALYVSGLPFSLFLIIVHHRLLNWKKSMFYLLMLGTFYALSVFVCFISWGLAVPIAGGAGEFLIKKYSIIT